MGFARPDVSVLVGVVVMGVAWVLEIVGLAAPGWCTLWVGEKGKTLVGLWEFCYELPKFTCEDLEELWTVQGWLEGSRAMGVLGVVVQGVCLITVLLLCFLHHYPLFFVLPPWTALVSGLLIFLEFAIFVAGVEKEQNSLGRDLRYQYAFALTIVAFLLSFAAALAFFIGEARNRKTTEL